MLLLDEIYKIKWTGNTVLKVRERGENLNIFDLWEILLQDKVFLIKDEILWYVFKLREKNMKKEGFKVEYACRSCGEWYEKDIGMDILSYKDWNFGAEIEVNGKNITLVEPNRDIKKEVIKRDQIDSLYNVKEMCKCLKNDELGKIDDKVDWVMGLEIEDFVKLEKFYNENRFVFNPFLTFECSECGKETVIEIDTLPNILEEWM